MVSPDSRPAMLSQRHVDALTRGHDDPEAARLIRSARAAPPPGEQPPVTGAARPVEASAAELEAVRRSGVAPPALLGRIASAAVTPSKHGAERRAGASLSSPSTEPPSAR